MRYLPKKLNPLLVLHVRLVHNVMWKITDLNSGSSWKEKRSMTLKVGFIISSQDSDENVT